MVELVGVVAYWTVGNARAAEPAFIGIHHDGWLALYRIGHKYVTAAYIHAGIATNAFALVKRYALIRRCGIGDKISFVHNQHSSRQPCFS